MPGFAGDLASRDNDELRRILCDEMPDTFRWLLDSGVRFMGRRAGRFAAQVAAAKSTAR